MKIFFYALLMLALSAFTFWMYGPGIVQDFSRSEASATRSFEYRVSEADCDVHWFVLSSCDLGFTHIVSGEEHEFSYMMFGNMGGADVYALKAPDGSITSNVGLAYFWRRVITLLVMGGLLLVLAFVPLMNLVRHGSVAAPNSPASRRPRRS